MARVLGSNIVSDILVIEDHPVVRAPVPEKKDEIVIHTPAVPSMMESLARIDVRSAKRKPVYADTWVIGGSDGLQVTETYETDAATIIIGTAEDGEMEYNIVPNEYNYPIELDTIVESTIDHLRSEYRRTGGHMDRIRALSVADRFLWEHEEEIGAIVSPECTVKDAISELSEVVYRYTIGKGIFDILLADERLEDIYVDAPCEKNRILHMCQHMQTAVSPTWQRSINTPFFPNHATFGRSAYSA